ncbi:low molecular weight protein-tyrosine-phosphatase [Thomasclavelia cocleata]|uniref:low molecular weight protein-tyrosine-phosphatase n=1 Tax=Thomasclavelia cocleata TaxID=69824 RepID=UPI0025A9F2F2|nr:low molecular weight protein-tyrosine-phosphatase [Thomasclavelia cocleata]
MIKILFVCLGNICRSPMAEFVMKDMAQKQGLEEEVYIESAATSSEEIGNGMHSGTIAKLTEMKIPFTNRKARQLTKDDYENFDYILGMENKNLHAIRKIVGQDSERKISRLLDFSQTPRDIADPWYTGNFDVTYQDIVEGCKSFLQWIKERTNG